MRSGSVSSLINKACSYIFFLLAVNGLLAYVEFLAALSVAKATIGVLDDLDDLF